MDKKKEIFGIVNESSKVLIDASVLLEGEISLGELKLLVHVVNEQLKKDNKGSWVKLDDAAIFGTSDVTLARWQKKLKNQGLLEQYGVRSLMWKVPKKMLKSMEITTTETKIVGLTIQELKEHLNKLQGKDISIRFKWTSMTANSECKQFRFNEKNIEGENTFIFQNKSKRNEIMIKEKDIHSSELVISTEKSIKINTTDVIITISEF